LKSGINPLGITTTTGIPMTTTTGTTMVNPTGFAFGANPMTGAGFPAANIFIG
jgi:hypothetical protein